MEEVSEEEERENFPPDEFEAEEVPGPALVNSDDEDGEPAEKKVKQKSAAKKVVKNPQAKLDDMRLCGQRGLPLLPKTFRDVKFHGKGHESRDLDVFLSKMEHWAHRMFPKMVFDEVLQRCDRLHKTKKLVKTTLIRMRAGDTLLDEDKEEEDDVLREGADDIDDEDLGILSSTRSLDLLSQQHTMHDSYSGPDATASQNATRVPSPPAEPSQPPIDEEARQRMERNKRIAMEKRKARIQAMELAAPTSNNLVPSGIQSDGAATAPYLASQPAAISIIDTPPIVIAENTSSQAEPVTETSDKVCHREDNVEKKSGKALDRDGNAAIHLTEITSGMENDTYSESELSESTKRNNMPNADLEEDDLLELINA